ncbi:MAG: hypothetical protein GX809_02710 [Clostridiaceae bacterium]|nr:hypothetical protein [Clostridiaceae bacterium]
MDFVIRADGLYTARRWTSLSVVSKGNWITDIFYRSNDVININFTNGRDNGNVTIKLTGNKFEFMTLTGRSEDKEWKNTDMGGVYKAALFPDIAIYPSRFPLR